MAEYICIEDQLGGCNYTLHCGTKITSVEADSFEEAFEKFVEVCYWDKYFSGECNPQSLTDGEHGRDTVRIIKVAESRDQMFLDALDEALESYKIAKGIRQATRDELKLERLAEKLGKKVT